MYYISQKTKCDIDRTYNIKTVLQLEVEVWTSTMHLPLIHPSSYLVHCQIYASIGDDAQNIGDVALVECLHSLLLEYFLGTVKHS